MIRRVHRFALLTTILAIVPFTGPSGAATIASARPARLAQPQAVPTPCPGCWHPRLRLSWQWQLDSPPKAANLLDVRVYDVDGFESSARLVRAMHDRGIKAVCYLSAGSWEDVRPDAGDFPDGVLGRSNGWPGERWLDIRQIDVLQPIMDARLDMCGTKGFDAVELDNVDGYQNRTGFPLTGADQRAYDELLANDAHARGLSVLLKNDLGQVKALLPYFDGALNEQCHQYGECGRLVPFIEAGKPVFGVEYKLSVGEFCPQANTRNFNFLKKRLALGAWRAPCRGA
jgi:hypothetical protein